MTGTFIHNLNKENFFYNAIATLAYTQFGINELFSRGFFLLKMKEFPVRAQFEAHIREFDFPPEVLTEIFRTRTFTPQIFVPAFRTNDKKREYRFDTNTSAGRLVLDTGGRTNKNIELTHMTIIAAWERICPYKLPDKPVLQFFRHIRNAAAHNGKFHFTQKVIDQKSGELLKDAVWNSFDIKAAYQDMPLIPLDKQEQGAFWDQGDLVEFLLDFENHYPQLKSIPA